MKREQLVEDGDQLGAHRAVSVGLAGERLDRARHARTERLTQQALLRADPMEEGGVRHAQALRHPRNRRARTVRDEGGARGVSDLGVGDASRPGHSY